MSKATRQFFEDLKAGNEIGPLEAAKEGILALAPGLKNLVSEIGAELGRLGVQGQMEAASLIYNGSAFVPYGPGQYKTEAETAIESPDLQQQRQEQERGGREI